MNHTDQAICSEAEDLIDQADHCTNEEAYDSLMTRAYALLSPLVEGGFPPALYLHACRTLSCEKLEDEAHARRHAELIKRAAEAGHARAQFALGQLLEDGDGLPKDHAAAAHWFEQSAHQGYAYAQWVHGLDLLLGLLGVQRNTELGLEFIRRAAEGKFLGAMEFVADAYASGLHGYPKDETAAEDWRRRMLEPDVMRY